MINMLRTLTFFSNFKNCDSASAAIMLCLLCVLIHVDMNHGSPVFRLYAKVYSGIHNQSHMYSRTLHDTMSIYVSMYYHTCMSERFNLPDSVRFMVYACLDTCCSQFLTIIAGVDLHFRHESKLPVCRTRALNPGRRGARRGC